jgi:hypothetical protein
MAFVETNPRVPTVNTVARICRAFGLPVAKVIGAVERRLQ